MLSHAFFVVVALCGLQEPPKDLLGSWQCDTGTMKYFEFQAKKLALYAEGQGQKQLVFFPVAYQPGKILANFMGKKATWAFEVKGDELKLTIEGMAQPLTCRRLRGTPEELRIKMLDLGKPETIPQETLDKIRKELADRIKVDQAVRTDPKRAPEMGKVDADNTGYLIQLIKEFGWIDADRFGAVPSNNAFLLVQHSGNLSLMSTALPLIKKDVVAKKLDAQPYALLYDRLMLYTGEKQRYGTQLSQNEKGELVLGGMEDQARVEEFRKEIGLFPLSQYLKMFGDKKVIFEED